MKTRNFGFDFIRSTAILLVMMGHTLGFVYAGELSFFISFLSGFFGVELFFVLSGVLIGGILIQVFSGGNLVKNIQNFLIRRWMRTLPLYYVMLLVYGLGNTFFDSVTNEGVPFWKYLFFIQNFFQVQPTFFGISWSLSIEEWFYVLFPLVLFFLKKGFPAISLKNLFLLAAAIFILYFLVMRIFALHEYHFHFYEGARKIAFLRLDAIAFGILGAVAFYFFPDWLKKNRFWLLVLGIFILMINQYQIFKDQYSHLDYFNTVYYSFLGIGLLLLFPVFRFWNVSKNLFTTGITFLSKISYSLYLVHWLVFRLVSLSFFSFLPGFGKLLLFLFLSTVFAGFTYFFIEKPALRLREKMVLK